MSGKPIEYLKEVGWQNFFPIYSNILYIYYGIKVFKYNNIKSYLWSFAFINLGLSSFLFHKYMCNKTSLLDEYSMLLLEVLMIYSCIFKKVGNKKFYACILSLWILSIFIHYKTNHLIHFILISISVLLLFYKNNKNSYKIIFTFLFATFLWLLNLHKVVNDKGFFHGLWHILTAYSLYLLHNNFISY